MKAKEICLVNGLIFPDADYRINYKEPSPGIKIPLSIEIKSYIKQRTRSGDPFLYDYEVPYKSILYINKGPAAGD